MAEKGQSDLLGALPRTRPQRRSSKRPVRNGEPAAASSQGEPGAAKTPAAKRVKRAPRKPARRQPRLHQPPQPRGIPSQPRAPVPPGDDRPDAVTTAVQAAVELTQIGFSLSARLVRRAVSRFPRP